MCERPFLRELSKWGRAAKVHSSNSWPLQVGKTTKNNLI